jgi:amidase
MNEIVLASATRQLELLRTGQISVAELAEAHIEQIERLNPQLNAFADFDAERVRARGAAAGCVAGTARPAARIAGHGEVFDCDRGVSLRDRQPAAQRRNSHEDAVVVARLRAAGALILGTTNCPEFLMAYETANLLHGRTRNPWDLERSPGRIERRRVGGHCGGAFGGRAGQRQRRLGARARALHRHLFAQAHAGPDSRPRPSAAVRGAVFDTRRHRPMARTMADVALLFRTLAARTRSIRSVPPVALREPSLDELRTQTIGFFEDDGLVPVTPETRAAVRAAAQRLRDAGFRVEPFRPRTLEPLRKLWWKFLCNAGPCSMSRRFAARRPTEPHLQGVSLLLRSRQPPLTATELLDAWAELDLLRAKTARGDERLSRCCFVRWPAFPPSATASAPGPSKADVKYLDAVRTRSGSMRWPRRRRGSGRQLARGIAHRRADCGAAL